MSIRGRLYKTDVTGLKAGKQGTKLKVIKVELTGDKQRF